MKNIKKNIYLVAKKSDKPGNKLDYYILMPNGKKEYLFTRNYTEHCYKLCKSGVRLEKIVHIRENDRGVMNLVKQLNYIIPYMAKYLEPEIFTVNNEIKKVC